MRSLSDTLFLLRILDGYYGIVPPFLIHETPFQLLVAVILSAQATDSLVNTVTPTLFSRFPDAYSLSRASLEEIESLISRVNYFRTKARYLLNMSYVLVAQYGGNVPNTFGALMALPGVGRKVANVVMADAFGVASGVCVDTHVFRVSRRVGWSHAGNALGVERDLMLQLPEECWINTPKQLILIGRQFCFARKRPACDVCPLRTHCLKKI